VFERSRKFASVPHAGPELSKLTAIARHRYRAVERRRSAGRMPDLCGNRLGAGL